MTVLSSQFAAGVASGLAVWLIVYGLNRAWLGFWSFTR